MANIVVYAGSDNVVHIIGSARNVVGRTAIREDLARHMAMAPDLRIEKRNVLVQDSRFADEFIWSGTDQYRPGKYIRDHVFDASAIDVQLGCAGLLIAMAALDRTISFDGKMPHPPAPIPPDLPDVHPPEPKSWGRTAVYRDPDGNTISVTQLPGEDSLSSRGMG